MKDLKKLGKVYRKDKERIWMSVPRKDLLKVCERLRHDYGIKRVISVTGNDTGKVIEVIYHLELGHGVLSVKTDVSKKSNAVPSTTPVFKSANLFERELAEMLGLQVKGHPNLKKLFLPEDIDHPLRKK